MASSPSLARRAARMPWLVTIPLAVLTIVSGWVASTEDRASTSWWLIVLAFVGFVAADRPILTIEVRRHAMRVSAVEIPLLLSLAYPPPLSLIVARAAAVVVTQVMRRSDFVKAVFNVAAIAAGTSIAGLFVASASHH